MEQQTKLVIFDDTGHPTHPVSARQIYFFFEADLSHWTRWKKRWLANADPNDCMITQIGKGKNGHMMYDYMITTEYALQISIQSKKKKGQELRELIIKYISDRQDNKQKERPEVVFTDINLRITKLFDNAYKQIDSVFAGIAAEFKEIIEERKPLQSFKELPSPKEEAFDHLMKLPDTAMSIGEAAKLLKCYKKQGELFGRNTLFEYLRKVNVLFKSKRGHEPYQKFLHYFVVKEIPVTIKQQEVIKIQLFIRPNGFKQLRERLKKDGYKFMEE